jgi:hypothetical protein
MCDLRGFCIAAAALLLAPVVAEALWRYSPAGRRAARREKNMQRFQEILEELAPIFQRHRQVAYAALRARQLQEQEREQEQEQEPERVQRHRRRRRRRPREGAAPAAEQGQQPPAQEQRVQQALPEVQ